MIKSFERMTVLPYDLAELSTSLVRRHSVWFLTKEVIITCKDLQVTSPRLAIMSVIVQSISWCFMSGLYLRLIHERNDKITP